MLEVFGGKCSSWWGLTPTMYHPPPPPQIKVASLKSDMNVKKGRMAGLTKLQLLHQSLTGGGDLDPGDVKGGDPSWCHTWKEMTGWMTPVMTVGPKVQFAAAEMTGGAAGLPPP